MNILISIFGCSLVVAVSWIGGSFLAGLSWCLGVGLVALGTPMVARISFLSSLGQPTGSDLLKPGS